MGCRNGRPDRRLRDRGGQRVRTRARQHLRPAAASGQRGGHAPGAVNRGASQSGGETSGYPWHKSQCRKAWLGSRFPGGNTWGTGSLTKRRTHGPGQSGRGSADANAEGYSRPYELLERVHAGTVDAMDRGTEMEVREHLVTIRLRIQAVQIRQGSITEAVPKSCQRWGPGTDCQTRA